MRSARAPRLLREPVVESDELLIELVSLLVDELASVLEVDEPEVEPEAPMPDELLLGVLLDEELALGVVVEVEPDVLPEAPIVLDERSVLLDELLGVLVDDEGVLEEDVPMPEPALSPPVLGAVELVLLLVPVPLPAPLEPACAAA